MKRKQKHERQNKGQIKDKINDLITIISKREAAAAELENTAGEERSWFVAYYNQTIRQERRHFLDLLHYLHHNVGKIMDELAVEETRPEQIEPLPCVCGGSATVYVFNEQWRVFCGEMLCRREYMGPHGGTRDGAVETWNGIITK